MDPNVFASMYDNCIIVHACSQCVWIKILRWKRTNQHLHYCVFYPISDSANGPYSLNFFLEGSKRSNKGQQMKHVLFLSLVHTISNLFDFNVLLWLQNERTDTARRTQLLWVIEDWSIHLLCLIYASINYSNLFTYSR